MENDTNTSARVPDQDGRTRAGPGRDVIGTRLHLTKRAASGARRLVVEIRRCRGGKFVRKEGRQDFVTEADPAAKSLIRETIPDLFPGEPVLGEEHGLDRGSGRGCWVVDPTDGTANCLGELPDRAVSIAYCEGENILCGVIHAPESGESAWARIGGGCHLKGLPASASPCDAPSRAVVLTGRSNRSSEDGCLAFLDAVMDGGMACRHIGSGALSLMQVACGRVEAFCETHLNPWDAVAGILVVREAGGHVDFPDVERFLRCSGPARASNSGMRARIKSMVQQASGCTYRQARGGRRPKH